MKRWRVQWPWIAAGTAFGCALTLGIQFASKTLSSSDTREQSAKRSSTATIGIIGDPALGSNTAPVTIVEFSDFECPYCKRFHEETFPKLKHDYINKGLVRFIHKDLPLPFHRNAHLAATTARCAKEDGKYWEAYEVLFNKQNCLDCHGPIAITTTIGIDQNKLQKCTKKKSATQPVDINISEAELNGIRATPTFVIGTSSEHLHNGTVIEGAIPWEELKPIVEKAVIQARKK